MRRTRKGRRRAPRLPHRMRGCRCLFLPRPVLSHRYAPAAPTFSCRASSLSAHACLHSPFLCMRACACDVCEYFDLLLFARTQLASVCAGQGRGGGGRQGCPIACGVAGAYVRVDLGGGHAVACAGAYLRPGLCFRLAMRRQPQPFLVVHFPFLRMRVCTLLFCVCALVLAMSASILIFFVCAHPTCFRVTRTSGWRRRAPRLPHRKRGCRCLFAPRPVLSHRYAPAAPTFSCRAFSLSAHARLCWRCLQVFDFSFVHTYILYVSLPSSRVFLLVSALLVFVK